MIFNQTNMNKGSLVNRGIPEGTVQTCDGELQIIDIRERRMMTLWLQPNHVLDGTSAKSSVIAYLRGRYNRVDDYYDLDRDGRKWCILEIQIVERVSYDAYEAVVMFQEIPPQSQGFEVSIG